MDPGWLSNAYLVWDEPGGTAIFVDSGAPLGPLHKTVEEQRVTPTYLLITHGHGDHVAGNDELVARYGVEIATGPRIPARRSTTRTRSSSSCCRT